MNTQTLLTKENIENLDSEGNIIDINIVQKLRKIITYIKYSEEGKQLYKEGYKKYKSNYLSSNIRIKNVILDNNTRWNSTYNMLNIAIVLKKSIIYVLNNTTKREIKNVTISG